MLHNINKTLQVVLDDGRVMTGKLLVFDKHMNVVLGDVVEKRPTTKKMAAEGVEAVRSLGLVLLRGEHVVSTTVTEAASSGTGAQGADFSRAPKTLAGAKRVREEEGNEGTKRAKQ